MCIITSYLIKQSSGFVLSEQMNGLKCDGLKEAHDGGYDCFFHGGYRMLICTGNQSSELRLYEEINGQECYGLAEAYHGSYRCRYYGEDLKLSCSRGISNINKP